MRYSRAMEKRIYKADLSNAFDAQVVIEMVQCLAGDEISGHMQLSEEVTNKLIPALQKYSNAFAILAVVDGNAAGMSLCFESLSSFKARPIVNIHDFVVKNDFRRLGLAKGLLKATQQEAENRGACKLTLEVLEGNVLAQNLYKNFGFKGYELDPKQGKAMFYEMPLD